MVQTARFTMRHSMGFSLVEITVGMMIGLIGVAVMMQIFNVAEGYKRTTTGTSDAQSNGAVALYAIQKDVRQSGYGLNSRGLIGCNVQLPSGVTLSTLAPTTINHPDIPAGDANTDTVLVIYGNANGSPDGDRIVAWPSANIFSVSTPTSFQVGDRVVAQFSPVPTPCNLMMEPVLARTDVPPNVTVATGVMSDATGGNLFNFGQAPSILGYAIRNGNLTQCNFMTSNCSSNGLINDPAVWVPIGSNIVSLRAQYGSDSSLPMDMVIDSPYHATTPASSCGWLRMLAIRFVLVARSEQYEKEIITAAVPTWAGSSDAPINLAGNTEWQHYRYKVFQTVAPLRNMVALGANANCLNVL